MKILEGCKYIVIITQNQEPECVIDNGPDPVQIVLDLTGDVDFLYLDFPRVAGSQQSAVLSSFSPASLAQD